MADRTRKRDFVMLNLIRAARRRHAFLQQTVLTSMVHRKNTVVLCLIVLLLLSKEKTVIHRSCRRLQRNTSKWFEFIKETYSDKRFKKHLGCQKTHFSTSWTILGMILNARPLQKFLFLLTSDSLSAFIVSGVATTITLSPKWQELLHLTISAIVREVAASIVENLWDISVAHHFPVGETQFTDKILDMEELWQFLHCWSAIDGCHIPIKCPAGGLQACKEYHNFKNFYSIVLMGMIDAIYRFIWASCGFPGNSHDSIILQSTKLWEELTQGEILPKIAQNGGVNVPPLILGDSAFPLQTWLMKPYTHAVLTPEQKYFNYRLSRARMITEAAYGQLKGRWRVLHRKSESTPELVRTITLCCIVLHNICIDRNDILSRKLDLTNDPVTGQRRNRDKIRQLLHMGFSSPSRETGKAAESVRRSLTDKFWREKQGLH